MRLAAWGWRWSRPPLVGAALFGLLSGCAVNGGAGDTALIAIDAVAGLAGPSTLQSVALRAGDGTECATFDFAPGLLATAAHCASTDRFTLSDGRSASLLRRGAIEPLIDEVSITEADVAILLPSEPRRGLRPYRGALPVGTPLVVAPPSGGAVGCQLVQRRGAALLMRCRVKPGWSGSPVYTRRVGQWRVVGLLSGYEEDRNLSWAVHVSAIDAVLQ